MIPDIDLQLLATASQLAAQENEIERGKQRLRGLLASGELPGSEAVEREKDALRATYDHFRELEAEYILAREERLAAREGK